MNSTLIQMTLIMLCGAGWRFAKPAGLSAEQTRQVLTTVVYYLLLPAMVLEVLWTADIGWHSFQYTLLGAHRYTQVSARRRRSGRDAGTQTQGCETSYYSVSVEPPSYRPWHWIPASMPV